MRFNIKNLQKDDSTYSLGNLPFVYSMRQNKHDGTNEWQRGGFDVEYCRGPLKT